MMCINKCQMAVMPYVDKDCNLVIAYKPATGKTFIIEQAMLYHLGSGCGKVVYLAPYKSIISEKYNEWNNNYQLARYGLVSSCDGKDKRITGRVYVLTYEACDAKLRNDISWGKDISCVLIDEAHMLYDKKRWHVLDGILVSCVLINPAVRFVLVSGTINNNVMSIAKWVKRLNGKETKIFKSQWAPSTMKYNTIVVDGSGVVQLLSAVKNRILNNYCHGEKVLVFVHSKQLGRLLCKELRKCKIMCGFHNASLDANKRHKLENVFKNKNSGMDVLVSTTTLCMGVNL